MQIGAFKIRTDRDGNPLGACTVKDGRLTRWVPVPTESGGAQLIAASGTDYPGASRKPRTPEEWDMVEELRAMLEEFENHNPGREIVAPAPA